MDKVEEIEYKAEVLLCLTSDVEDVELQLYVGRNVLKLKNNVFIYSP